MLWRDTTITKEENNMMNLKNWKKWDCFANPDTYLIGIVIGIILGIIFLIPGSAVVAQSPGYISISSMIDSRILTINDTSEREWTRMHVNMPVDGYAKVDISGQINNMQASILSISVDGTKYPETERIYSCGGGICSVGFQTSGTFSLKKGDHTISLRGLAVPGLGGARVLHEITSAMISQNGELSVKYY